MLLTFYIYSGFSLLKVWSYDRIEMLNSWLQKKKLKIENHTDTKNTQFNCVRYKHLLFTDFWLTSFYKKIV